MAKKVLSNKHDSMTRERVMQPQQSGWKNPNGRAERRKAKRDMRKDYMATVVHDPRAVKFHF